MKWRWFTLYTLLLMQCIYTSCSQIKAVQNATTVWKDETAYLRWTVVADLQDSMKPITCAFKDGDKPTFVYGRAVGDSSFEFRVTEEGRNIFGQRLTLVAENSTRLTTSFSLHITSVVYSDENLYECTYGNHASSIQLTVNRKLNILAPGFPQQIQVEMNKTKNITVQLCAKPRPVITWTFLNHVTTTQGVETRDDVMFSRNKIRPVFCYDYTYTVLTTKAADCGKTITYSVKSFNHSIAGEIKVETYKLIPESPKDVLMTYNSQTKCLRVSWLGPNIGFCKTLLHYKVNVFDKKKLIETFQTSSNVVTICSIDAQIKSSNSVDVCTVIHNTTSPCTTAKAATQSLPETKTSDNRVRDTIIIAFIVCFLVIISLLLLVCFCYRRKIRRLKINKLAGKNDTENEDSPIQYQSLEELHDTEKGSNEGLYSETKDVETSIDERKCGSNAANAALLSQPRSSIDAERTSGVFTDEKITPINLDNANQGEKTNEKTKTQLHKHPFQRALSATEASPQEEEDEEEFDNLNRRKLKQSISVDHYDITQKKRHRNEPEGKSVYEDMTNEYKQQPIEKPNTNHVIYDVIPRSKTHLLDEKECGTRDSIGVDNPSPNVYEETEVLYDVPKMIEKQTHDDDNDDDGDSVVPESTVKRKQKQKQGVHVYENV